VDFRTLRSEVGDTLYYKINGSDKIWSGRIISESMAIVAYTGFFLQSMADMAEVAEEMSERNSGV